MPYQGGQNPRGPQARKKVRRKPATGGHPSQGRPTVGGGTKHKPVVPYRSPTPSVKVQRSRRKKVGKAISKPVTEKEKRAFRRKRARTLVGLRGTARLKVKDTDTHIGPFNLEAELEGRGGLQKGANWLKKELTKKRVGDVSAAQAIGFQMGFGKLGENAVKDLVDLPAQTVASTYALAAGGKEAAQGRPERIKDLWKQAKKHDPVVLAAQGKFGQAKKEAEKHPLVTGLEVTGIGKGLSRGAGKAVKPKPRVKKAPGTNIERVERSKSGAVGRAGEAVHRRRQLKKVRKIYRRADQASAEGASPKDVAALRARAAESDPRRVSEREIEHRFDEREALAESRRRGNRTRVVKRVDKALKHEPEAALLVAQRVVPPTKQGFRDYRAQLEREAPDKRLSPAKAATNRRLRRTVKRAEKADLAKAQRSAERYAEIVAPLQRELVRRGVLAPGQERMAKLIPYAVQNMGAKWRPAESKVQKANFKPPSGGGWKKTPRQDGKVQWTRAGRLERDGRSLKPREIEGHMRERGIDPDSTAFVSQHPSQRGAKNFYTAWQEPKGIGGGKRTGEAVRKGTFELDKELGRENAVRMQGLVDAHNEYAEFVKEFGYREGGKVKRFKTRKEADEFIADLAERPAEKGGELTPSTYEWQAVPTRPQFGKRDQADALLDQADTGMETHPDVLGGLDRAVDEAVESGGDHVVVLKPAANRMRQHLKVLDASPAGKAWRMGMRQFKSTVLTTNPGWVTGNLLEAALRAAVNRAGPVDYAFAKAVHRRLAEIDAAMGDELIHRLGAGHFGMQELQAIHTTAESFRGTAFQPVARGLGALRRTPGPKQLADAWSAYTRFVFDKNGAVEKQVKLAMLGQHARHTLMERGDLLHWNKAVEQAARGLTGTNEQVAAASAVRRAYGRYEAWGPSARKAIALYTPFVAWTGNAIQFLVSVLPKDHPVLTGLLAADYIATEEWRKKMGLGKFIEGAAPGYVQGAIPQGSKWLRIQRYTPFALAGDPVETLGSALLPNLSGTWLATKGLDWRGRPLNQHDDVEDVSDAEKARAAMAAFLSASLPLFGQITRGAKKEGTPAEKALHTVNPFEGVPRTDPKLSVAFDRRTKVTDRLDTIRKTKKKGGQRVDADNPTAEYERLLARNRKLNNDIFRLSQGRYGRKPAASNPFARGGSSDNPFAREPSWVDDSGDTPSWGGGKNGPSWVDEPAD